MARLATCVVCLLIGVACSTNEVTRHQMTGGMSLQSMEKVFLRTEKAHTESMSGIMRSMSIPKAVRVLEKSHMNTTALLQVTGMLQKKNLRKQPKGYSGIEGARKLLNDMIFESMTKYDSEIAKCTEYYSVQCGAMESCRGQIAASNYIAANSRALILDSQSTINRCEEDIPTRKLELREHNLKCKRELHKMNQRLKIVLGDIAVMTMILEMTDCDKKLLQMEHFSLLHCTDQCTKKSFVQFNHDGLQKKVSHLQSTVAQNLMSETFSDLFDGIKSLEVDAFKQEPIANKTQFNNPPTPRTEVPMNPCSDPNKGAPSMADKNAAKCTIKKSPQCYKLQERFLLIQAGIEDERDDIQENIAMLENYCEETKGTIETQIQNDQDMLSNAQTKLAAATEKEATAGETARQTATQHEELENDLTKQMKDCSTNYINFETELCALKKIRGELYKMKGSGHSAFFQDCEVSKWDPEECDKKCAKGEQKLTRSVMTPPSGGAKCLPLEALRSCNNHPCPVNCKLSTWSGWSKCSAECGGGVQQRLREVKRAMKYGGDPCGESSETQACNGQACEKDCVLSGWSRWSLCSKDCDGGTQKREKMMFKPAEGAGKCPDKWDKKRLEYKECNMKRCKTTNSKMAMPCNKTVDVVLLLDGSGSLGKKGWKASIKAATMFAEAFESSGKANMALILFSGPKTWSGVDKCTGGKQKVDPKDCGIKIVTHFTEDIKKVKNLILGLEWPQGSTLTSLALMTAKAELSLGRKQAASSVVVITDGRPLSYRKTGAASKALRKSARLVWVPVTKYAPMASIKKWATRRWQENVVRVKDFKELEKPDIITHIIADICPQQEPKQVQFEPEDFEDPTMEAGGISMD